MKFSIPKKGIVYLQDGTMFEGFAAGKLGTTTGEICFNTAMTGYQETFTDPSYFQQIRSQHPDRNFKEIIERILPNYLEALYDRLVYSHQGSVSSARVGRFDTLPDHTRRGSFQPVSRFCSHGSICNVASLTL